MASTIRLTDTLAAVIPVTKYRPMAFPTVSIYEPACTLANLILLTILGPPFRWRWNRKSTPVTFTCSTTQPTPTDYSVSVPQFGWIETAAVKDLADNTPAWTQMTRVEGLAMATEAGLPHVIAPQYDDGAGNITFRLSPSPAQNYPVILDIQQKPVPFSAAGAQIAQTWAPIPDEYSHLYTWGMMAMAMLLADDVRFPQMNQKFVTTLLATHGGLTELEMNIFLTTWQSLTGSPTMLMQRLQQGIQARSQ